METTIQEKKKKMTLEDFATAIQKDLSQIKNNMATKEDIRKIREEMTGMATKEDLKQYATKEDLQRLPSYTDVQSMIGGAKQEILKEMDKFKYGKEIDAIRARVVHIEKKLDIKPAVS